MTAPRDWSEDELLVLAAIYFKADFSIGDDARDECRTIAACFDRSAAAVDRQWRNMDAIVKSKTGLNIGRLVRQAVANHLANPAGYRSLALRTCEVNGWPLLDLIRDGQQSALNTPVEQAGSSGIGDLLGRFARGMEFTIFPAGAQGFEREGIVEFDGGRYNMRLTAVAVGTRGRPEVHVPTRPAELAAALGPVMGQVVPKVFNTGRRGYYGEGRVTVGSVRFQVAIRAVQTGEVET